MQNNTLPVGDLERETLKNFIDCDHIANYRKSLLSLYTSWVRHGDDLDKAYREEITYHFEVFWQLLDAVEPFQDLRHLELEKARENSPLWQAHVAALARQ